MNIMNFTKRKAQMLENRGLIDIISETKDKLHIQVKDKQLTVDVLNRQIIEAIEHSEFIWDMIDADFILRFAFALKEDELSFAEMFLSLQNFTEQCTNDNKEKYKKLIEEYIEIIENKLKDKEIEWMDRALEVICNEA